MQTNIKLDYYIFIKFLFLLKDKMSRMQGRAQGRLPSKLYIFECNTIMCVHCICMYSVCFFKSVEGEIINSSR